MELYNLYKIFDIDEISRMSNLIYNTLHMKIIETIHQKNVYALSARLFKLLDCDHAEIINTCYYIVNLNKNYKKRSFTFYTNGKILVNVKSRAFYTNDIKIAFDEINITENQIEEFLYGII